MQYCYNKLIDYLRNTYKIPFVGVEPAIKPAANNTKTGVIGVLATKGTLTVIFLI
jgi:glutamate racemase